MMELNLRLFGVAIPVSVTSDDQRKLYDLTPLESFTPSSSLPTHFLLQERPIQESVCRPILDVSDVVDGVDTSLKLSIESPGDYSDVKKREEIKKRRPRMTKKRDPVEFHGVGIALSRNMNNPKPLRWFHPEVELSLGGLVYTQSGAFQESENSANAGVGAWPVLSPAAPRNGDEQGKLPKRRKRDAVTTVEKKRKSMKRTQHRNPVVDEQIPSLEGIPLLVQAIESQNGTRPIFLYRKKLETSDVKPDQNRLFVTKSGRLMDFLTEEERTSVNNKNKGLNVTAVDAWKRFYKLHLCMWPSLKMVIINLGWKKLVVKNNVQKGSTVEVWGYRVNGKLCFAVNFRALEEAQENQDF